MRSYAREPRTYELMTVLHPEVPEEELQTALDRIAGHVTGAGGTVAETLRDSPWGRRRLAYPIRNAGRDLRDGYYTVFHVSLGPERVEEMEQEIKLNTQIIRYMVTAYEPQPIDPRAIEAAEIAAEDAAAAAYAAAQTEAARLTRQSQPRSAQPPPPREPGGPPVPTEAGGDQPIQGAAGVAGQPPPTGGEGVDGPPTAGAQRAEAEAPTEATTAEAEPPTEATTAAAAAPTALAEGDATTNELASEPETAVTAPAEEPETAPDESAPPEPEEG